LDGATAFFDGVIPCLTAHVTVVTFFLPLRPAAMPETAYTLDYLASELAAAVDDVLAATGNSPAVHLVGESFGGVVVQVYERRHCHRAVASLVLLSSLAKTSLPPEVAWKADNLLPILKGVGWLLPGVAQAIFARLHVDDVCEPTEPQAVKDLFVHEASRADFRSVMSRIGLVRHLDMVEEARAIALPTLIVHGDDDHFTKASSLELHGLIKGSTLRSLPGGHLPHITSPDLFADMIVAHIASATAPVR
jgi:pimeloyl-ACP methyl ester carboxylesterase